MALAVVGPDAEKLAAVAKDLDGSDAAARASACSMIASAGEKGASHFGKVLQLLQSDSSVVVQRSAASAVALVAKGHEGQAVPALLTMLDHQDATLRACSAKSLGVLKADVAVDKLGNLCKDTHMIVRSSALTALAECGQSSASQVEAVVANMQVPMVRDKAIRALGKMNQGKYASDIMVFLEDSDANVRLAVADAFGDMRDSIPDEVVSRVADLLNHRCDRYRATAAITLGSIGAEKAAKYVGGLVRLLRESTFVQPAHMSPNCAACIALGRMGVKSDEVAKYLDAKRAVLRAAACQGLGEMPKGAAGKYTGKMVELLQDENQGVRACALRALEAILDKDPGGAEASVVAAVEKAKSAGI